MFAKSYKAFTLAEVLVTLGIIGVVSAMTIPALTQNWQKKAYATQLHKVYNEIIQAFEQAKTDKMALSIYETGYLPPACGRNHNIKDFLHTYFKVVKDCGNSYSGCFADSYRTINGGSAEGIDNCNTVYVITTASGAAIAFTDSGSRIDIDINGTKGPNIAGRDLFRIYYFGGKINYTYNSRYDNCTNSHGAIGCFERLVHDGWEMKY